MAASSCPRGAALQGYRALIFVTVGAQMPFDRLVKTVEDWAKERGRDDVFAQIGDSSYRPTGIKWARHVEPDEYLRCCDTATAIVAHAGTGSIIAALRIGKPIIIMPRHASLMETRNDHQVATAKQFQRFASVRVAWDEKELFSRLDEIDNLEGQQSVGQYASVELLSAIREFIEGLK